jgi:hypothetical protein
MVCEKLVISGHAFQKIFERYITVENVETVISEGEIIKEYRDDKPYPSFLLLGFINGTPLHVVVAKNEAENFCILVTAYFPDETIWDSAFKNKIT